MRITTRKNNDELTLFLSGRLDTNSSPELEQTIAENTAGITSVVLDLSELAYTSSAGLRVFLKTQKLMMNRQGTLKLTHVSDEITEILEMTGFTDILTIE